MKRKRYLLNTLVCMSFFCAGIVYAQYASSLSPDSHLKESIGRHDQNHPPDVKITTPEDKSTFEWNTLLRYAIIVEDAEDGASEYQEIAPNEVFLEAMYLPDIAKVDDYLHAAAETEPVGLELLKVSDCFSCHAVKTKMAGPSFNALADRYSLVTDTVAMLAKRVVKGSSGNWGSTPMPPHPDLTENQAKQMVKWLLTQAGNPDWDLYAGTEGAFRTKAMPESGEKGIYVLTATYTDHGLDGQERKRGQHTIMLHSK